MKLFKREKKTDSTSDAVAEKIAGSIMAKQRRVADYLNNKMEKFTRNTITNVLIIFCVAFGAYCAYLLISSIIN